MCCYLWRVYFVTLVFILSRNLITKSVHDAAIWIAVTIYGLSFIYEQLEELFHQVFVFDYQENIPVWQLYWQAFPWVEWDLTFEKLIVHVVEVFSKHPPFGTCTTINEAHDSMEMKTGMRLDTLDLLCLLLLSNQVFFLKPIILKSFRTFQIVNNSLFSSFTTFLFVFKNVLVCFQNVLWVFYYYFVGDYNFIKLQLYVAIILSKILHFFIKCKITFNGGNFVFGK